MNNNPKERRERRAWILLILIVPLGIGCMLLAGQTAIRMLPRWSVNADMGSNLNPNDGSAYNNSVGLVEPIKPNILTPAAWAASFLTPHPGGGSGTVVPFVVFTETATTTATVESSPTDTSTSTGTATATPPPPVGTITTITKTKKPGGGGGTSTATITVTASPSPAVSSTIDTSSLNPVSVPGNYNPGAGDGNSTDITVGNQGAYFVVTANAPVHVEATPDGNYDMVYYEVENPAGSGQVAMDQVIIGISQFSTGNPYYEVFNWGNSQPDTNSNLNTNNPSPALDPAEPDNQAVLTSDLYPGASSPGAPSTGILIDVDNAPSHPPAGDYPYIVVIIPPAPSPTPPGADNSGQIDSIQVTEVPNP